ncbi:MAG: portal protein [Nitrososphaera sp.]
MAEQEEATFGRVRWIDAADDLEDQQRQDIAPMISLLIDDFDLAFVPAAISEVYLNGAIYGTGIAKVVVEQVPEASVPGDVDIRMRVVVRLVAVEPKEFVIDPAAKTIDSGLGCAHVTLVPRHSIRTKQQQGVYSSAEPVGDYSPDSKFTREGESNLSSMRGLVKIIEYHGLVPREYLYPAPDGEEDLLDAVSEPDEGDLVESIVTIANDSILLRAIANPFLMKDRSFVAYPHDKVPNRFWGRGVCEKGYNPQKQLDAELRARIDALGFSVHPMIGMDASRLPRGTKLEVSPGRSILTTGDPREILYPIQFPPPDGQTYRQAADMERMVQMGTGAMDSASPIGVSPRNATASGMSMLLAGALKRSKRTMQNIERYFLRPMVEKALWRYMQFAPERYPERDYKFIVRSSMGIMAREVEQQLLTNLIATVPTESPAYWMILKAIFENSSVSIKDEVVTLLDMMIQQSMQPKKPEPDPNAEANMARVQLETRVHQDKMLLEVEKLKLEHKKAEQTDRKLLIEYMGAQSEVEKEEAERKKLVADAMLSEAKAYAEAFDARLAGRKLAIDASIEQGAQKFEQAHAVFEATKSVLEARSERADKDAERTERQAEGLESLSKKVEGIARTLSKPAPAAGIPAPVSLEPVLRRLDALQGKLEKLPKRGKTKIERDVKGKVVSVNGNPVERDEQGLIVGVADGE